ncbi:hypothetical protein CMV_024885 [Castanea mollissima]|uniref:Uncharacterized protein n=1 Tax=Castanea mollissima TaxID=60419 RepID=A0A8J4QDJ7_9ROSI|nr:hypothetical protein CMV_024885 [Castanea mollissima]
MDQCAFNNGKKIQAVLESEADCEEETIDQPMPDVPKNTTCPASDGFESDTNSGNEAPNPGDGELSMGFMIRVHLQSSILFSMMIPMLQTPVGFFQDIEPACLADPCYSSNQLLRSQIRIQREKNDGERDKEGCHASFLLGSCGSIFNEKSL